MPKPKYNKALKIAVKIAVIINVKKTPKTDSNSFSNIKPNIAEGIISKLAETIKRTYLGFCTQFLLSKIKFNNFKAYKDFYKRLKEMDLNKKEYYTSFQKLIKNKKEKFWNYLIHKNKIRTMRFIYHFKQKILRLFKKV